jgi:rhamnulokinase
VDYGLVDAAGNLISNPACYRDNRTQGAMERVFARLSRSEIFEKTGIQFLNFNTLFQLDSEDGDIKQAEKLLLIPDLINYLLTGNAVCEYTNATTTQMVNAGTRNWDAELLKRLDIPVRLLPEIVAAGTDLGVLKPGMAEEVDLHGVRVTAPATHDTGSAVAGAPLLEDSAYISSGTWSLIGTERAEALINTDVARHNFTNEGGAFGTFRFLKNVMGLWIFESCRREWMRQGVEIRYEMILREVAAISGHKGFIFPDDERFLNPASMIDAIREQFRETGQHFDVHPAVVSKVIFDSLGFRYASVLRTIEALTGRKLTGIQILGGGGQNGYLNQVTANASRLPVRSGLTEATVVGNVLVQAIASGRFASLAEGRRHVADSFTFEEFLPQSSPDLDQAEQRYAEIEARFVH